MSEVLSLEPGRLERGCLARDQLGFLGRGLLELLLGLHHLSDVGPDRRHPLHARCAVVLVARGRGRAPGRKRVAVVLPHAPARDARSECRRFHVVVNHALDFVGEVIVGPGVAQGAAD